jgi:Na+-translocating ferredoxin:NAD+ oxidoreductase subunit D
MTRKLNVSSSPHVHGGVSTASIMWTVVACLAPAAGWSVYLFGLDALSVIIATVIGSIVFEALAEKVSGRPVSIADGSAALTGTILALSLPPGCPIYVCLVGALVAVVVAKAFFGGLGQNPFNPAMTGRVFLLIAFPAPLTRWLVPGGTGESLFGHPVTRTEGVDAITAATPLGLLAERGTDALTEMSWVDSLLAGVSNGSAGETSAILLLIGGGVLLARRIITWHIPVAYLGAMGIIAGATHLAAPDLYAGPLFHLLSGAAVLGAFFIATDYVTSPMHPVGKLIFGAGCGVLTMVIRLWAGYPEGVSFAVLLMNAAVPIIDTYTRPKKFGFVPPAPAVEKEGEA